MVRQRIHGSRAGTTMIELLFMMSLLSLIVGALFALGNAGTRLFNSGISRASLESRAAQTIDRLERDLESARADSFDALPASPLWQESISFDRVASIRGYDGRITWTTSRVELRYEAGELDDGIDNDGDELIDECEAVLVLDDSGPNEQTIVLAHEVREYLEGETANGADDNGNGLIDERGLCFERTGDDLALRLTLEARDREGRLMTRSLETSVYPRN